MPTLKFLNVKNIDNFVAFSTRIMYFTWRDIKKLYTNKKPKTAAPKWNNKFELPDKLYSVSYIQIQFEYIIKKHEILTDNPSIRTYAYKI